MSQAITTDWHAIADSVTPQTQLFIGGEFVDAATGETFAMINPATGEHRCDVAAGGDEDVDRAVRSARASFESGVWSRSGPGDRKRVLFALADLLERDAEEIAVLLTLDMGKPISDSIGEVAGSVKHLRYFAEAIDKVFGEVAPVGPDGVAFVTREPIGVVGAVVPWNYPLMMPMWKLGPALASGNSVVLKPAEQSPLAALKLAELAAEADLPDGVLNVVTGLGETAGQAIGRHMDVDKVAFTGSGEVGGLFLKYAAESNLKSVSLECGGKSPAIVLGDAPDLEIVARMTAQGIWENTGQVCNAGSRILVHRDRRDELAERLDAVAREWAPGDPLDAGTPMGPLVNEPQLERVLGYMRIADEEGVTVASGGNRVREDLGGYFFAPTVLTDVDNRMRVAQEEIFGPVVSLIDFDSEDDAVRAANDTRYGLAAGVWTRDVTKAHRISRALRAGSVYVNCWDYGDVSLPFGGYKASGIGRDKSLHAMDGYTELKSTYINLID
jgi:acyl-CoA reductase-like NAD-dependent aldehyde dehydrogenase